MKKQASPPLRQAREIGLTAVLRTVRIAPRISGDFASSVMGKYLGTENYRNFFARMVFHILPEGEDREREKEKREVVHHTHVYHRYVRVYQTVHSAPVYRYRYLRSRDRAQGDRVHPVLRITDGQAEIKNVK
ncbi:MAG: hypothetical protein IJT32_00630, partial [Lachnospiraceae bacterium]|nr:hypothetical protein [Lachnospiraceae bacterium]